MSQKKINRLKRTVKPIHRSFQWYWRLSKSDSRVKRSISLALLALFAFLSFFSLSYLFDPYFLKDWTHLKETLSDMGLVGMLIYILMVVILPFFSPLILVIVTGSVAFGSFLGFCLSYIGCMINANIVYFLVKALFTGKTWGNGGKSLQLKQAMHRHGFWVVIVLQFTTVVPFTLVNGVAASADVSWKKVMKANCIGICPTLLLYSYMGSEFTANTVSPKVYFAGIFVMLLMILVLAVRRKVLRKTGED